MLDGSREADREENSEALPLSLRRKPWRGRVVALTPVETGGVPWSELERRLLEMGFVEGAWLEILHEGPSGAIRSPCGWTIAPSPSAAATPPRSSARASTASDAGAAPGPRHRALVGNPNCGKTALFNALTGTRQKVANYAGVTVERKEGGLLTPGGRASACSTCPAPIRCAAAAPTRRSPATPCSAGWPASAARTSWSASPTPPICAWCCAWSWS